MIKFVFTTRNGPASALISEFSREEWQRREDTPAHMLILIFDCLVLESRFQTGVHLTTWNEVKKKDTVIDCFKKIKEDSFYTSMKTFKRILDQSYGKGYDFKAITYFSWRYFLKRYFNRELPKSNKLEDPNRWFCNELWELDSDGEEASMLSPNDVMIKMRSSANIYTRCEVPR